jgi:hypothetical protein
MAAPPNSIVDLASLERAILELPFGLGPVWWRGHANFDWKLRASVFRPRDNRSYEERGLMLSFKARAMGRLGNKKAPSSEIEWLFLAQHYSLPTRLLDWTENPLAAIYFAVTDQSAFDFDGCLYAISPSDLNVALANPLKPGQGPSGYVSPDEKPIRALAMRAFGFTDEAIRRNLFPEDKSLIELPRVAALGPVETDERIVAQSGRFTIHGDESPLDEVCEIGRCLRKFRIPSNSKRQQSNLLLRLGIRRWNLFPDLQSLAEEMKDAEF